MDAPSPSPRIGWPARLENGLLVTLLGLLIVVAIGQLLARNLFGAGWSDADPLMRTLVLWVGLTGAMVATREHRHIAIVLLPERLPPRWRARVTLAAQLFTAAVAATVAYHGARFVLMEAHYPVIAFAAVPTWATAAIIPFAFGVIAVRALHDALTACREAPR